MKRTTKQMLGSAPIGRVMTFAMLLLVTLSLAAVQFAGPLSDAVASAVTLMLYLRIRREVLPERDA